MQKKNFNKGWQIRKNSGILTMPSANEPAPVIVDLPHDAMLATVRAADNPTGGGGAFFQGENIEYTKRFEVPAADEGKLYYIAFEGVHSNANVWVNGEYAGQWPYGYSAFTLRIDEFLNFGAENTIAVYAKNGAQPNSRWYIGTGIYRNVDLMVAPQLHIAPDGVRITTIDADAELAVVEVVTQVAHAGTGYRSGYLDTVLKTADGRIAAEATGKFSVKSNETVTVRQRFTVRNPRLWDAENPNLYLCESTLRSGDEALDSASASFGIRKLQLDAVHGLRVNGRTVKLKGGCIHHDNGVLGAATYDDAEERRARILKSAGYNAIRSAHNPVSPAMLRACDKVGLYVMDEFSDVWTQTKMEYDYAIHFEEWWERDVEAMVRKDYNHPCVVMYSIGNEIPETGALRGASWGRKLAEKFRSLDSTRYITDGINIMLSIKDHMGRIMHEIQAQDTARDGADINEAMTARRAHMDKILSHPMVDDALAEVCGVLDIVGYNYAANRYESDHEKFPHRVIVGSETGGHALDTNWPLVEKLDCVIGDFVWTCWDYLGEVGIGRVNYEKDGPSGFYGGYPWISAFCGDVDLTGYRLPISYWRETIWGSRGHTPYIAVQKPWRFGQKVGFSGWGWTDSVSTWTWPGYEGKNVRVEAYSDVDEVELLINGESQGRKPVGNEVHGYYTTWEVPYQPGTVEAVAYLNGEEVGRYALQTAGEAHICLSSERESVLAGSEQLVYVNVELVDANGVLNTSAENVITLSVEGPVSLLGSGSADPETTESYLEPVHKPFYGRLIAVLRAGSEAGVAKITASAEGMDSVTLEIPVTGA